MRGKLIIFSAPSGTGKSTIISWLMKEHKELNLAFSISCTSRAPRGSEQNGVEYFFCSQMCEIKPCVIRKGYESCAECAEMDSCEKLAAEIGNNEEAKDNLKRIKAIHHRE